MDKLSRVVETYLDKIGLKEQLDQVKWLQKWPQVVGGHICRYASPLFLKEGVLWVEVSDSNWLYHLITLQQKIMADYNRIIGFNAIRKIKMINTGSIDRAGINTDFSTVRKDFPEVGPAKENISLDQQEKNKIELLLELTPVHYRDTLRSIINHFYLQQKGKFADGAEACLVCGLPCYKNEAREGLCLFCHRESENWLETLRTIFKRRPWLSLSELKKSNFNFPREEILRFCKEKIRRECFEKIMKFFDKEGLQAGDKENILNRLILRYIVFVAEKEPSQIQPEDEFRALRDFGGLFGNLELGKIEHNNT